MSNLKEDSDYKEIVAKWNTIADKHNKWDMLGEDEKIEFAFKLGIMIGWKSSIL